MFLNIQLKDGTGFILDLGEGDMRKVAIAILGQGDEKYFLFVDMDGECFIVPKEDVRYLTVRKEK